MSNEARAGHLVGLFGMITLGHQNEPVTCGQVGQSLGHAGQQFNFLLSNGAYKASNALSLLLGHRRRAKPLKTSKQRVRKAGKAVAVR